MISEIDWSAIDLGVRFGLLLLLICGAALSAKLASYMAKLNKTLYDRNDQSFTWRQDHQNLWVFPMAISLIVIAVAVITACLLWAKDVFGWESFGWTVAALISSGSAFYYSYPKEQMDRESDFSREPPREARS